MIKFRVWNQIDSEYINEINAVISLDGSHIWWDINDSGEMEYEDDPGNYKLEQFIGLKDVNGKDIYEGDIIKSIPNDPLFELSKFGVVTRSRIDLKWCYESGNIEHTIWASGRYRAYEVIGNVHDTPELLEEKQ